jgi:hypothetical protein
VPISPTHLAAVHVKATNLRFHPIGGRRTLSLGAQLAGSSNDQWCREGLTTVHGVPTPRWGSRCEHLGSMRERYDYLLLAVGSSGRR